MCRFSGVEWGHEESAPWLFLSKHKRCNDVHLLVSWPCCCHFVSRKATQNHPSRFPETSWLGALGPRSGTTAVQTGIRVFSNWLSASNTNMRPRTRHPNQTQSEPQIESQTMPKSGPTLSEKSTPAGPICETKMGTHCGTKMGSHCGILIVFQLKSPGGHPRIWHDMRAHFGLVFLPLGPRFFRPRGLRFCVPAGHPAELG